MHNLLSSSLLSENIKIKTCRAVILPVILYGCETSCGTLREQYKLTVFENGVLRKTFGPRRYEVREEWRRLRSEELHDRYSFPILFG